MPSIYHDQEQLEQSMLELQEKLRLSTDQLRKIIDIMTTEMQKGLSCSNSGSSLEMLLSHVSLMPNGSERGCYLALDLGGTDFRILLINLKDGKIEADKPNVEITNQVFAVPEEVLGDGESFFDHIAKCMASFCRINGLTDTHIHVGFTFSFPLKLQRLNSAVLLKWNKGLDVSGVVGNDVVQMLATAIKKQTDISCEVVAIVNDTVGTLMSCAHSVPNCKIGLVVGKGCNACYMEKLSNVSSVNATEGQMCINMEWGAFGDNGVLDEYRNEYDREVDATSNLTGHLYEKMIGGEYMGELVRLVLCKFTDDGVLFGGKGSEKLYQKGTFETSFVCEVESHLANHSHGPYLTVRNILLALNIEADDTDCEIMRQICGLISSRAAHMCAAGVSAVALKIKSNHPEEETMDITVAVDGTVYRKHPTFSDILKEKVNELCEETGVTINFVLSYDGSGKGAALVAAAAKGKS